MTVLKPDPSLEDIRREIDAIDGAMLDLLIRRFGLTGKVRASKTGDGSLAASPLRPAREAAMLRRLIAQAKGHLTPELTVRLWRVILSASAQAQAPIVVHLDPDTAGDLDSRLCIAEHFCGMEIAVHADSGSAFEALHSRRGDVAIFQTGSRWAEFFPESAAHGVRVIGARPVVHQKSQPQVLIFGHAEAQASGGDETLILSRTAIAPGVLPARRWQVQSGGWTVTSIAGFLSAEAAPLSTLIQSGNAARIAGRYPCPIEAVS